MPAPEAWPRRSFRVLGGQSPHTRLPSMLTATTLIATLATLSALVQHAQSDAGNPSLSTTVDLEGARRLLDRTYRDMFGQGSIVEPRTSLSEIERESLREIQKCGHCPKVPFGFANDSWNRLKAKVQNGDELVFFRNSKHAWEQLAGAEGYALIREGRIVDAFLTGMS